jgi:Arc/MetJ-type ribon-helix-helix transcriptional regulator
MSDEIGGAAAGAAPPEMVEVVVRVPARVLADYDADVSRGIYENRDEALRLGLVESWRYHQGRYSTLRIELRESPDKRPDTGKPEAGRRLPSTVSAVSQLPPSIPPEYRIGYCPRTPAQ